MNEHHLLRGHLKTLRLPTMLSEYLEVSRQCLAEESTYPEFLERLTEREWLARQNKSINRRLRQAGFPGPKELADFDFLSVPRLNKKRVLDLAKCAFIKERSNVVLLGAPGVGKTHLAIALGREACRKGFRVKFFTGSGLVNTYLEAREQKTILRLEAQIAKCDAVVIDELGYIPMDKVGAEHLFGFFSLCYERTSLVITTNLPFADWPRIFGGDERLAGALIDRLTHRINLLEILGDSYRFHSSLRKKKDGAIKDND
jgi:DNA replication protein DnaC